MHLVHGGQRYTCPFTWALSAVLLCQWVIWVALRSTSCVVIVIVLITIILLFCFCFDNLEYGQWSVPSLCFSSEWRGKSCQCQSKTLILSQLHMKDMVWKIGWYGGRVSGSTGKSRQCPSTTGLRVDKAIAKGKKPGQQCQYQWTLIVQRRKRVEKMIAKIIVWKGRRPLKKKFLNELCLFWGARLMWSFFAK